MRYSLRTRPPLSRYIVPVAVSRRPLSRRTSSYRASNGKDTTGPIYDAFGPQRIVGEPRAAGTSVVIGASTIRLRPVLRPDAMMPAQGDYLQSLGFSVPYLIPARQCFSPPPPRVYKPSSTMYLGHPKPMETSRENAEGEHEGVVPFGQSCE